MDEMQWARGLFPFLSKSWAIEGEMLEVQRDTVPNDGFLLKHLKHFLGYPEYFHNSIEMHFERRYESTWSF